MLKSIEQEWSGFSQMIYAKMTPSPVQLEETKRAFFAGAWAIFCASKRIGDPDISEAEALKWFGDRQREGEEFYRELITKYAEGN